MLMHKGYLARRYEPDHQRKAYDNGDPEEFHCT
jgi:hypothetical protein